MCEAEGLTSCDVINRANNEATPSRNGNSDHFLQLAAIQTHAGLSQRQMMKKKIFCGFLIKKSQNIFSQITLKSECCETVAKGFS